MQALCLHGAATHHRQADRAVQPLAEAWVGSSHPRRAAAHHGHQQRPERDLSALCSCKEGASGVRHQRRGGREQRGQVRERRFIGAAALRAAAHREEGQNRHLLPSISGLGGPSVHSGLRGARQAQVAPRRVRIKSARATARTAHKERAPAASGAQQPARTSKTLPGASVGGSCGAAGVGGTLAGAGTVNVATTCEPAAQRASDLRGRMQRVVSVGERACPGRDAARRVRTRAERRPAGAFAASCGAACDATRRRVASGLSGLRAPHAACVRARAPLPRRTRQKVAQRERQGFTHRRAACPEAPLRGARAAAHGRRAQGNEGGHGTEHRVGSARAFAPRQAASSAVSPP